MSDLATRAQTQLAPVAGQLDPMTVASVFRASGMFPDIQSEAAAATKIIIGRGLGITDFDAMSGLHIIKGKAVLAANLMAAAIKRAGKYDYRAAVNDDEARIEFRQRTHEGGWETIGITSFTMEDAKRAGLGGDNWRKYPKAMLFARAISAGYKAHCPDALGAAPVYVEAHGESEIPEEPKAETKAISPAAMREMTREERREDVRKLLDSGKAETPAPQPKGDDTFTIPKNAKIARVKGPKGDVWRVDVEGHAPIAVKEPTIASGIEANLAFEEPTLVRLEHDGKREIVMEILKQEVMA
ncbi:MAG: hypothetical protein ACK52I_25550 [Pseudomonadota bacterium]